MLFSIIFLQAHYSRSSTVEMMKSKLYGQLNESTATMGVAMDGDQANMDSHKVNTLNRPLAGVLDKKIEASMKSIRKMQSMRQLGSQAIVVGTGPARANSLRALGGDKTTTGTTIPKRSSPPTLMTPNQTNMDSPQEEDVNQVQKQGTAAQKRSVGKGQRTQSSRLSVYQNKAFSRSSGRPKRRMEVGRKLSLDATDSAQTKESTETRPVVSPDRKSPHRTSLTKRKQKKSKQSKKPQPMDVSELLNMSWENPRDQSFATFKAPEEEELNFADFANLSIQRANTEELVSTHAKVSESTEEVDFAEFANLSWKRENPKEETAVKATRRSSRNKDKELRSSRHKLVSEMDATDHSAKGARRSTYPRQVPESPNVGRLSLTRETTKKTPSSKRRQAHSRTPLVSPSARSISLTSQGLGKRALSRSKLPVTPEQDHLVSTSTHVNKLGIGEIAQLLERSKRVHAESQQQEEEKRDARLAKIRARRRSKKEPASPEEPVKTPWESSSPMGGPAIATM